MHQELTFTTSAMNYASLESAITYGLKLIDSPLCAESVARCAWNCHRSAAAAKRGEQAALVRKAAHNRREKQAGEQAGERS